MQLDTVETGLYGQARGLPVAFDDSGNLNHAQASKRLTQTQYPRLRLSIA
jgi:hypothetical protein